MMPFLNPEYGEQVTKNIQMNSFSLICFYVESEIATLVDLKLQVSVTLIRTHVTNKQALEFSVEELFDYTV